MPVLVDLDPENFATLPCCGMKNPAHEGRRRKNCWVKANFKKGLRAKVLLTPDNRQCGYVEYLPGEYAWRGVDARGYMFIHCVFTFRRQYQHRGVAGMMLEACVEDARKAGMHGVAVIARDQPWLAGPAVFQKNGFEKVDEAPPDYQLFVRRLNPAAANPAFRRGWEEKLKKYNRGLTIIRANQCPHSAKFADDIAEAAEKDYGLTPRVVELRSHREAQNAPTPYAVFAVILNGRLLADHQISRTRFRNIMRKLPARDLRA
jgi:GNAT superfamily N-acetyltransferase